MTMLNIYDLATRRKTAVLQNAYDIFDIHELNKIYTLSFTIPKTDEKVQYLQPRHYVRWGDTAELYRIKSPKTDESDVSTITYECEHVITTLCDSIIFGSHNVGGYQMRTRDVIEWLLSQQKVKNWELDECDFDRRFEYLWEQENVLNALYSIPQEFGVPYKWVFDTTRYPWKLSLKAIDTSIKPEFYLQAKSNILSSGNTADYADICTRIYPLGYGEGINQLTIEEALVKDGEVDEVNGTRYGKTYIDAPQSYIDKYGLVEKVLVDRRFEYANSLYAYAKTTLEMYMEPAMSRTFDVTDLYPLTKQSWDDAEVGKVCRMMEDGTTAFITKTVHQLDNPGYLKIDLSTKTDDVSSSIAALAERVRIETVYAQGATQLYQHGKDANATPEKGMHINLYFPNEMRKINKVQLKLQLEPFRSYSQATESAGEVTETSTSGGGSTQTSTSGGGSTQTSTSGGGSTQTSTSGGGSTQTSTSGGGSTQTSTSDGGSTQTSSTDGGQGETSTGNATISGVVTSGPSSVMTTYGGGFGSDIVTEKVYLELNTEYDKNSLTKENTFSLTGHSTTSPVNASGSDNYYTDLIEENGWDPIYPGILHYDLGYTNVRSSGNKSDAEGHYHAIWYNSLRHKHQFYHFHGLNLKNVGSHNHALYDHRHRIYHEAGHSHTIAKEKLSHQHGMDHTHSIEISKIGSHSHTFSFGGHSHEVTIPSHSHEVTIPDHSHDVSIPDHTHDVSIPDHTHDVSIPSHTHDVSIPSHTHDVSIPAHSHEITPGIFESGNPTAFEIWVNGIKKTTVDNTSYNGNITEWIVNGENMVPRETWIDIEIKPNDLAYVVSSVFVQGFVQSRGGGVY